METLTQQDFALVNDLSSRTYSGNTLLSNATEDERTHLKSITLKLKEIAAFFSEKHNNQYGPFAIGVSTGNPIAIGGIKFKNVWAGLFKGASNKQYAAQISFVMSQEEPCLNVGFYFGSASAHSLSKAEKEELESQLIGLGIRLSDEISHNNSVRSKFQRLFDDGFQAHFKGSRELPDDWVNRIRKQTANSYVFTKIYPDDFGIIENSTIDSFVAQLIFLMGVLGNENISEAKSHNTPLTPTQRAKQAERRALIGHKGEIHVMDYEKKRLAAIGLGSNDYPRHVALESMSHGYDILSLDKDGKEIYIEVKTTIRTSEDLDSKRFYISTNEVDVFEENKERYVIYRVYDIDNTPTLELVDLEKTSRTPNGYIATY